MNDGPKLLVVIAMVVIGLGIWFGVYSCIRHDCAARGGHMETIYGGKNNQYMCVGATR